MKSKAFIPALVLIFTIWGTTAFAQKNNDSKKIKEKVDKTLTQLDEHLKLEKSKRNAVEGIFTEFYTKQQQLKNNIQGPASGLGQGLTSQNFQSIRKQNETLVNQRDAQLKKELSEGQYKKWKTEVEPTLRFGRKK